MNGQHRDSAGSRDKSTMFLTRCKQTTGVRCRKRLQNRQLYLLQLVNVKHLRSFHFMFFICISRHKLLFIALYVVTKGSLSMSGVVKNDFSELQHGCQKLVITLDSCLLFVNRGGL